MSLLGSQVFANSTTPCWLSTGGGEVEGSIAVRDSVAIVPTVTSGTSALILGPGAAPDFPYTSLIESTPVDIGTSLGSELSFYTRRNTPAIPPTLAMTIDSTQNVTITGQVTAAKLNLPTVAIDPTGPTAGVASIKAGLNNEVIATTAVTADSIILVTRMGNAATGPGIGSGQQAIMIPSSQIVPGVQFEAFLVDPATGIQVAANTVDAEFSWVIIN